MYNRWAAFQFYEQSRLFELEHCVTVRRSTLAHYSTGLDLCSAIPACCCSCFRQRLLVASPDCLLSIGCRT